MCYGVAEAALLLKHIGTCAVQWVYSQATADVAGRDLQGLDWYTKGLKEDRDGDVATEFLEEASAPHPAQLRSTVEDAHASLQACSIPGSLRPCSRLTGTLNVLAAERCLHFSCRADRLASGHVGGMGGAATTCSSCRHARSLRMLFYSCCGDMLRKPDAHACRCSSMT